MRSLKKNAHLLLLLVVLAGYIAYAAIFIYQTSVVVDGERTFVLFDDAMISMQYAKNFANGHGLVWNVGGERVEGYTNPLWVLYMAIFHLLPIPLSKMGLAIQISGMIFLSLNLVFVKKIVEEVTSSSWLALLAVIMTAFYYPLNYWSLQGMEVSILVLAVSCSLWLVIRSLNDGRYSVWPYLILGIATLVRTDIVALFAPLVGLLFITDPKHRMKHLVWGLGILGAFLIVQTVFRLWYYGDFLPNTYYLKMTGYPLISRLSRGLFVLAKFVWNFNWILFLLPLLLLRFRRDRIIILLFLVFGAQVAYSVYVGGDAWEHIGGSNRYISLGMPAFFILFVIAGDKVRLLVLNALENSAPHSSRGTIISNLSLVAFILISLINVNALLDTNSLRRLFLVYEIDRSNERYVTIAKTINTITTENARVAVVTAGTIPYFTGRHSIDLLGKNDAHIAKGPVAISTSVFDVNNFRPGHVKWDYSYSIGEMQPDVIAQWWEGFDETQPYINVAYTRRDFYGIAMYLRNDSSYILWDRVASLPE